MNDSSNGTADQSKGRGGSESSAMALIRGLSVILVLVMVSIIIFGAVSGDFSDEGSVLLGLAWGKVTLVDLYVGLAIFGAWVLIREASVGRALLWWVGLALLGNLAAAVYLAISAFESGDMRQLLLGKGVHA